MHGKLGEVQKSVLRSLRDHGCWSPRCGWVWDNTSGTKKILESLRRRGFVEVLANGTYIPAREKAK